ncbi:MAG: right-handed parallel beta-helix repeat-containing protein [Acidobacteriota bacterium]
MECDGARVLADEGPASARAGARALVIMLLCLPVWTLTATGEPDLGGQSPAGSATLRTVTLIAPPLPGPTGRVINVSTEPQLQSAVRSLRSDTTVVLARGTYLLTSTLAIKGDVSRVGIRGATNNRDDVVLVGPGMAQAKFGNAPSGIWTGGGVQGVTIANLTIRDFYQHPIVFNAGTDTPLIHNVHLINAGQQFIKANPDGAGGGVNNGVVQYCVIEYITTAKDDYTNGIDVHTGAGWIIRHNLFRNIVGPPGTLAGPAVLVWNHSRDTLTEGNTFLNCARGISYGLVTRNDGSDHSGGVIRNNFFFRASNQPGDAGIHVADSPNTHVLNNTVFVSGTYGAPIEYRFAGATGVALTNNLIDGVILARDDAQGRERTNLTGAQSAMFVDAASGDLHLASSAVAAIDSGTALSEVVDDWDGMSRPQGRGYDIGADEYASSADR